MHSQGTLTEGEGSVQLTSTLRKVVLLKKEKLLCSSTSIFSSSFMFLCFFLFSDCFCSSVINSKTGVSKFFPCKIFSKKPTKDIASHVPFSFWIGKDKVKFFIVVLLPKDS